MENTLSRAREGPLELPQMGGAIPNSFWSVRGGFSRPKSTSKDTMHTKRVDPQSPSLLTLLKGCQRRWAPLHQIKAPAHQMHPQPVPRGPQKA